MKYLLLFLINIYVVIATAGFDSPKIKYRSPFEDPDKVRARLPTKHLSEMDDSKYYYDRESYNVDEFFKKECGVKFSPRSQRTKKLLREKISKIFRSKSSVN